MANLNKVMLIGRLTRDPEAIPTRSTASKGAKFGFAVNNRKKDQATGEWVDDPVFIDCEVWNRNEQNPQAERVLQNLHKGHQVFIEGHLRMDKWVQDGQNRSKLVVVIDNFQYLERREDGGYNEGGGGMRTARPTPAAKAPAPSQNGSHYDDEPDPGPPMGGQHQDEEIPF